MPTDSSVALVTGSSRGLGRNTALALADTGTDVIVTYHANSEAAAEVVAEINGKGQRAVALQLDASDASSFAAFAARVRDVLATTFQTDHVRVIVNNAGTGVYAPFAETSEADLDHLFALHVKGPFLLTQALLPVLADGGRIINVSTGLARFTLPGYSAYAAMKGAIEVLTRYQAQELGERGITANTVAPGAIETDFGGGAVRDNPDLNAYVASQIALGRVGVPDDVGPMIASLVSDANRWVNGQRIEVSGGQSL